MSTDDIVIVAAARTPQGRLKGQLASFTAPQLGGFAIAGALAQGGIPADAVDAVILGQVLPAGSGQNPARQAAIAGGLGWNVPASAVNRVVRTRMVVVLPAPLGPRNPTTSPSAMSRSTPSTALTSRFFFPFPVWNTWTNPRAWIMRTPLLDVVEWCTDSCVRRCAHVIVC